jgi:hypothetical protein
MNNATTEKLKMIQNDLRLVFDEIGRKHDIQLNTGTLSYNELYFTLPLKGRFLDALGTTAEADKEEFKIYAPKFGLAPDLFGQMISIGFKVYKIVGIAPKARKYPVVGENAGKKYKLTAEDVRMAVTIAQKKIADKGIEAPKEAIA